MLALGIAAALGLAPLEPIEWTAPPQCPSAADARAQIHELLGGAPDPETHARVTIHEGQDAWVAEIDVEEAVVRTLQHEDCATLTEAAALVVAVALDPIRIVDSAGLRSWRTPDPIPEIPAAPPPAIESPPTEHATSDRVTEDPPPAATPRPLLHALRFGGGATYAPVPKIAGAIMIGHAVAGRLWRVETGIAYATPRALLYDDRKGASFQTLALDVRACVAPGVGRVRFPLCAGPSAGLVLTSGIGLERSRSPVRGFVILGVGGGVRVDVHRRVALWASGEASFGLLRPRFHVEGRPLLFTAPIPGGRGLLGVEIVWP